MYHSLQKRNDYAPCLCANGDLSLSPNAEGMLYANPTDSEMRRRWGFSSNHVFRAGKRTYSNPEKGLRGNLLRFGCFNFECGAALDDFDEELVLPDGYVKSTCRYSDGSVIDSVFFTHFSKNVYLVKKIYHGDNKRVSFTFDFAIHVGSESVFYRDYKYSKTDCGFRTDFNIEGADSYHGSVNMFLDRETEYTEDGERCVLSFDVCDGEEFVLFYTIADSMDADNMREFSEALPNNADFDELFCEHTKLWRDYFSNGYIKTGDASLDSVYMTALYHMKCATTAWSIPVGINNAAWQGRYFAFDEFYGFHGLITSGRYELARHVPEFRLKNCLPKAVARATIYSDEQARFMWETTEYGDENAPIGAWNDHVFHMAVVALGAYEYYEYTLDREFLSECYRMIRACAKFYTVTMIYRDSVRGLYFGKCCDLERLGTSKQNAFMSSCGAICTLKVCADAAEILGIDAEYADECRKTADELLKNLPRDGEKYLPYDNADIRSIGVFAGKFPFDVLEDDDKRMLAAMEDFVANEGAFGNMYRTGKGVSSWYASWKAAAYARCKLAEKAWDSLSQVPGSCGVFNEMYEINEGDNVRFRPWFMTASGVFLTAVNETLLQSDGENVYLLPAFNRANASFRLAVKGGALCEAVIENRTVKRLTFTFRDGVEPKRFRVYLDGIEIAY